MTRDTIPAPPAACEPMSKQCLNTIRVAVRSELLLWHAERAKARNKLLAALIPIVSAIVAAGGTVAAARVEAGSKEVARQAVARADRDIDAALSRVASEAAERAVRLQNGLTRPEKQLQ